MNLNHFLFAALLFCIAIIPFTAATDDLALDAFKCSFKGNGKTLNLSKFEGKTIEGTPSGGGLQTYYLSLCGDLPAGTCLRDDASLCSRAGVGPQTWASNSIEPEPIATYIPAEGEKKHGFSLVYKNIKDTCDQSGVLTTIMNLYCADKPAEKFIIFPSTSSQCEITLEYSHPNFCAGGSSGGLSGGAIILIIIFCVAGVYFIGGFLLCKFYFKKPGCKDAIPQSGFWCALPGLFAAGVGCTFSFFRAKCCGGKGSDSSDYQSYGAVEEP